MGLDIHAVMPASSKSSPVAQGTANVPGSVAGGRGRFYPQLDGLRAVAILLVILDHHDGLNLPPAVAYVAAMGWIGVDAFFVLSGFLITKILLTYRPSLRAFGIFVLRRILRTWPLYFVLLAFTYLTFWNAPSWEQVNWFQHLLFLQNFTPRIVRTLGPTWSLCVEEHFYFIWPILVFLLPRRALLPALGVVLALSPLLRFWAWRHGLTWQVYFETQFHLDGLAAGGCVALLLPWHAASPRASRRVAVALLFLGAATAFAGFGRHWDVNDMIYRGTNVAFGFTSLAVSFAGLLWLLLHEERSLLVKLFSFTPLRYIGRISYGMYLLHYGLIALLLRIPYHRILGQVGDSWVFLFAFRIAVIVCVASISYRFFESPILRLKDRLK